jgi:hypothetical protein
MPKPRLKKTQQLFEKQDGTRATVNYMNPLARRRSIIITSAQPAWGGRISKTPTKHLLDTKQHGAIEPLSQQL